MKSYTKKQLADAAGVSTDTLRRWLIADRAYMEQQGVSCYARILPPHIVKYLSEKYGLDLK